MKRRDLMAWLRSHGCEILREGRAHTVLWNPANTKVSAVPRHTEINDYLARRICRDLGVPDPRSGSH